MIIALYRRIYPGLSLIRRFGTRRIGSACFLVYLHTISSQYPENLHHLNQMLGKRKL